MYPLIQSCDYLIFKFVSAFTVNSFMSDLLINNIKDNYTNTFKNINVKISTIDHTIIWIRNNE